MSQEGPTLVLMGLRGSGKSTLARLVARRLGIQSVDLDDATAAALGPGSIAEHWRALGEARFREAERDALIREVLAPGLTARVVALGGGTPTAPGAADMLRSAVGRRQIMLVYLRAEPATLRTRLGAADPASRPSLTGAGTLEEIDAVHHARDPLYQRLASRVIETDGRTAEDLTEQLVAITTASRRPAAPPDKTPR